MSRPSDPAELIEWANQRCLLEHLDRDEIEALTLEQLLKEIWGAELRTEVYLEHQAAATDRQLRPDAVDEYIEGRTPWVELSGGEVSLMGPDYD